MEMQATLKVHATHKHALHSYSSYSKSSQPSRHRSTIVPIIRHRMYKHYRHVPPSHYTPFRAIAWTASRLRCPYSLLTPASEAAASPSMMSDPIPMIMNVGKRSHAPLGTAVSWRVTHIRSIQSAAGPWLIAGCWVRGGKMERQTHFGMIHKKISCTRLLWPMLS